MSPLTHKPSGGSTHPHATRWFHSPTYHQVVLLTHLPPGGPTHQHANSWFHSPTCHQMVLFTHMVPCGPTHPHVTIWSHSPTRHQAVPLTHMPPCGPIPSHATMWFHSPTCNHVPRWCVGTSHDPGGCHGDGVLLTRAKRVPYYDLAVLYNEINYTKKIDNYNFNSIIVWNYLLYCKFFDQSKYFSTSLTE